MKANEEIRLFTETGCLELRTIQLLNAGKLSKEELRKVEKHLSSCDLCRDAVSGYRLISDTGHQKDIVDNLQLKLSKEVLHGAFRDVMAASTAPREPMLKESAVRYSTIRPASYMKKPKRWPVYVAVAASVLLIIGYFSLFDVKRTGRQITENLEQDKETYGTELPRQNEEPVVAASPPVRQAEEETQKPEAGTGGRSGKEVNAAVDQTATVTPAEEIHWPAATTAGVENATMTATDTAIIAEDRQADVIVAETVVETVMEESELADEKRKAERLTARADGAAPAAPDTGYAGEVFIVVEEMPSFVYKEYKDFSDYLLRNLKYPPDAQEQSIEGTVIVRANIGTDGMIKNPVVIRGVSPALDAEALRVIKSSPPWIPGKQGGMLVEVQMVFPVTFRLK